MVTSSVRLCSYCSTLVPLDDFDLSNPPHHTTIGALRWSSNTCGICRYILHNLDIPTKVGTDEPALVELENGAFDGATVDFSVTRRHALKDGLTSAEFSVITKIGPQSLSGCIVISTCEISSPAADRAIWKEHAPDMVQSRLALVTAWLRDCAAQHEDCQPAPGQLPERLISIDRVGQELVLRLVKTEHLNPTSLQYTTLSHCWGKTHVIKTTKETEPLFMKEIPFGELPHTFQDAIQVSWNVGIPLIWIDSLCIQQEDNEEWQVESAKMADIFQGSALTIAATDSPSSHGGCFLTLPPPVELSDLTANLCKAPAKFQMRHRDGAKELQVRLQAISVLLRVNKSVLNSRGWVLQEMVLSRRLLHCTRQELYWKCRCRCETELGMLYEATSKSHKLPRLRRDCLHKASETWYQWIRNYTPRVFSIYDDRLPAVAGITTFYQDVTGDSPMLGLWKKSLCQDLEWRPVPSTHIASASSGAAVYEFPSWSWFSCPYHIEFGFGAEYHMTTGHTTLHLQLIDFDLKWTSKQLTSAVAYARLIVQGPTMEVDFKSTYCDYDELRDATVLKASFVAQHAHGEYSGDHIANAYFDQESHKETFRATCLLLRTTETSELRREVFLFLRPACDGHNNSSIYRRTGLGLISTALADKPAFHNSVSRVIQLV